ncbi:NADH pyrophosphatase [Croceicoccus estronivorus]|uniref:NAD(+) diphosphatase n=1 Tax=Croceicoccus estronivorus TaxID=1172626 RepID=UPI00082F0BC0|nr:NAD(+) diphosphatase [Croceicoccus estronivorus]OCC22742.1 NADH pyrophosphatase [Croceicoccus estronivorus]
MMDALIGFVGQPLDRADHIRNDPEALEALKDERALLLLLEGLDPVMDDDNRLQWGSLSDAPTGAELVFLGLMDGRVCFAAVPSAGEGGPLNMGSSIRRVMGGMPSIDLALYGMARSVVDWHARHRFCAQCGGSTVPAKGGWQRDCSSCKAQHFPRVDPVTIMVVEHRGRLLLGRQPRFPEGFYSALAGFVEPGETVEEAVAREVMEEAGVRVNNVDYVMSQPWPFPSQLMIGCYARAEDDRLIVDRTELEDARWFTHEEVARAVAGQAEQSLEGAPFVPPPPVAIAHHLLKWWLRRDN